jgi:drug/metabolite transporter (DMT)-like permease
MAVLLIVLGNGLVTWAEQWIESNLAALLVSTGGFWLALIGTLGPKAQPLTLKTVVGLVVGFAGAVVILWPEDGLATDYLGAQFAIVMAPLAWSIGTVYGRSVTIDTPPLMFAAMQMFVGGLILVAIGLAAGELPHWRWTWPATAALVYLTLFGSCLAYGAYVWLINHTTPDRLSTVSYGNLAVATLLGWWLLDEALTAVELAGMTIIVAGMLLVNAPVGRLIRGSRIVRRRP